MGTISSTVGAGTPGLAFLRAVCALDFVHYLGNRASRLYYMAERTPLVASSSLAPAATNAPETGPSTDPKRDMEVLSDAIKTQESGLRRSRARNLGRILFTATVLLTLIALPICIWQLKEHDAENHIIAWFVGFVFVVLAVPLSVWDILQHLMNYHKPAQQTMIIRIMWMVPIYAIESWCALRFHYVAIYFETAREAYEAYVIYCFFTFLIMYLGGEQATIRLLKGKDAHHREQLFPFNHCCFKPWEGGVAFFNRCKFGTLQYVVLKLVCAIITFGTQYADNFCEGHFTDYSCGYPYVMIIANFSQIWAMYCLVMLYHCCLEEFKPIRPLPKFLCIKAVVFFTFWQSVVIAGLNHFGYIPETTLWTKEQVAAGLQDFMITIEMFLAAVAHHYFFNYRDFLTERGPVKGLMDALIESSVPTDVMSDFKEQIVGRGTREAVTTGEGDNYVEAMRRREEAQRKRDEEGGGSLADAFH